MIKYLREGGNQNIFSWKKSDGGLNIYSKFIKIVLKGIWNFRKISDCNTSICDSNGNSMDIAI